MRKPYVILIGSASGIGKSTIVDEFAKLGINPYPAALYDVTVKSTDITEKFEPMPQPDPENPLTPDKLAGEFSNVSIAGRIMSRRIMGAAAFMEIQDQFGKVQVYLKRDELCPGEDKTLYNTVFKKLLDIGDIVGIKGYAFVTQTGQKSIHAKELTVLCKSLRVLPIVKEKENQVFYGEKSYKVLYFFLAGKKSGRARLHHSEKGPWLPGRF